MHSYPKVLANCAVALHFINIFNSRTNNKTRSMASSIKVQLRLIRLAIQLCEAYRN